ncbi:hypothetical protein IW140_000211 [Coemansia sp. RSA 1813]|nr:hypothetical protein EV178_000414 [Coemansia sp. RSA 1646]KAJ1773815.1 hypothetical protein LPJ74_000359 [Coemansia sp. RSA 1843]KAJ2093778.1 hypothetical protein IW138_000174 [Coemansia sp. RSA 986]KAJ2217989.1 hypothetical protein EV179_000134 [Coemansia sp. RSA 487]KAJ2573168.1 hypothetical protein IW140_000211 [Coemansia sp. RSA 1813]
MPDLATTVNSPETRLAQTQHDEEEYSVAEWQCGRCSVESNFLVYLEFGQKLSTDARLCIERSVRRVLRSEGAYAEDRYHRASRKRRRFESSSAGRLSGRYRDNVRNKYYGSDDNTSTSDDNGGDVAVGTKRKREFEEKSIGTASRNSTLVMYGEDAGFDLDTTRDNDSDADLIEYKRGTRSIVGLTIDPMQSQGNACFNCSIPGHEIRDCPVPIDKREVEANRNKFKEKELGQFNSRLYIAVEEEKHAEQMRMKYRPGPQLSSELREALDLKNDGDIPEYVDSMYYYGYPPAYLGSDPGQDPMTARKSSGPKPPSSPTPLHVYNDTEDYGFERDIGDSNEGAKAGTAEGNKEDSDEEGAIDECDYVEESKKRDVNGEQDSTLPLSRNIPLVKYPGLDLNEFDFTSPDHPGKPLRKRSLYRYTEQSGRNDPSQRNLYDSPYRHNGNYWNEYNNGNLSNQRNNMYSDYYSQYQDDPAASTYSTQGQRELEWNAMLTGYYCAAQPGYHTNSRDALYSQEYAHSLPPDNPPPSLPPVSSQLSNAFETSTNAPAPQNDISNHVPSQSDENDDGELEDGECDMEESD